MRSSPSAMPPCGGVPYASASRKKPKRVPRLLVADAEELEDPGLQRRVVDPDAAAANLAAVQHEVVGLGPAPAPGRSRAGAMSSSTGDVNGWCRRRSGPAPGPTRSSGKSVTHRKRHAFSSTSFSSRPISRRSDAHGHRDRPGLVRRRRARCRPSRRRPSRAASGRTSADAPFSASLATVSSRGLQGQQVPLLAPGVGHDAAEPQLLVDLAQAHAGDAARGREHDGAGAGPRRPARPG